MIECFPSAFGGADEDPQIVAELVLPDKFVEGERAQ
jgi:hypothetical protein